MMPDSETTALSQKLSSLYNQRRAALQELAALRERQEHVPMGRVPGIGSALRVLKRSYLLPQMQTCQQTIDQLSLESAETLNALTGAAMANISAIFAGQLRRIESLDNVLKRQDERFAALEQSQSGLITHIGQIGTALAQLQESNAGLGTHLKLLNDAVSSLQAHQATLSTNINQLNQALADAQHSQSDLTGHVSQIDSALTELQGTHSQLGEHVVQINSALGSLQQDYARLQTLPDQVAVQDDAVQRLGAQVSYLPGSINELIADLRHQVEQMAQERQGMAVRAQPASGGDENRQTD